MLTLSQQLDKAYLIIAQKKGLEDAAEFLKSLITKYDIIQNKGKQNGTRTHKVRKQNPVL